LVPFFLGRLIHDLIIQRGKKQTNKTTHKISNFLSGGLYTCGVVPFFGEILNEKQTK
jgi:hypothetical protein